jgi:hypothetical protein
MSTNKTYLVRFCVHDWYLIKLTAENEDEAIDKAQELYRDECEEPFEYDDDEGGACDWMAEEVQS